MVKNRFKLKNKARVIKKYWKKLNKIKCIEWIALIILVSIAVNWTIEYIKYISADYTYTYGTSSGRGKRCGEINVSGKNYCLVGNYWIPVDSYEKIK